MQYMLTIHGGAMPFLQFSCQNTIGETVLPQILPYVAWVAGLSRLKVKAWLFFIGTGYELHTFNNISSEFWQALAYM